MSSCPALAFTKDEVLNTVVHHPERCIGCKYCTWACPYDAPKFSKDKGVVEKCTFCLHRLTEGRKPACANLCPTGALDYTEFERTDQHRIPGFTESGILPGIKIERLRRQKPPRSVMQLDEREEKQYKELELNTATKVSLEHEWVLVLFTVLVPVLTGLMAAGSLGWMELNPLPFMVAGIAGLILSSVHLGKKLRAWRTVLNIRNSWLSREITGYGLFLATSMAWFFFPDYLALGYAAALFGFVTSYAIDKVYMHLEKTTRLDMQSSSVFLTALLVTSLLTFNVRFAGLILLIKFLLYLYRKLYFIAHRKRVNYLVALARIITGFAIPVWIWFNADADPLWITALIVLGELIDRAEFYHEAEVITPERQMIKDLARMLPKP